MDLKPCPNPTCNHKNAPRLIARLNPSDFRWVYCPDCGVSGSLKENTDDAIKDWNALPRQDTSVSTMTFTIDGIEYLVNWQHIGQYTLCRIFWQDTDKRRARKFGTDIAVQGQTKRHPKDADDPAKGKLESLRRACGVDVVPNWRVFDGRKLFDTYRKLMHEQKGKQE